MMNSHDESELIGDRNCRTFGKMTINDSELDSDLTTEMNVTSTTRDSLESVDPSFITLRYKNHRASDNESKTSSYQAWNRRKNLSKSDSIDQSRSSSILAGNVGITSRGSSDSFHSAQSTIISNEETAANLNIALTESKQRDSNYNFGSTSQNDASVNSTFDSLSTSDQTSYMMPFLERLSKELNICPQKSQEKSADLIKRLSGPFAANPEEFKNRLLTIIEETELTNHHSQMEKSCLNSHRMTEELRKICKYIMDESMPVGMLVSPTADLHHQTNHQTSPPRKNVEETPENKRTSILVDLCTPQQPPIKKIYRKTPKFVDNVQKSSQSPLCISILKKNNVTPKTPVDSPSPRTPINTSPYNDSFTYWERYCEKIGTPVSESKKKRRSNSVPDIIYRIESENIKRNAVIQLLALDQSDDESFITPRSTDEYEYESFDSHTNTPGAELDLGKSILEEVARKRQRCYETEKTIREIGAEMNSSSSLHSSEDDHVLEYLNFVVDRCGEYQKCLMKNRDTIHKTLSNIEYQSKDSPYTKATPKSAQSKRITEKVQSAKLKLPVNSGSINAKNTKSTPHISSSLKTPNRKPLLTRSASNLSVKSKSSASSLQPPSAMKLCNTRTPRSARTPLRIPSTTINPAPTSLKGTRSSSQTLNSQPTAEKRVRYFETPGSSCRKPCVRSKPKKYFATPECDEKKSATTAKPKKVFTGIDYYGYSTVKSPVAEYIKSMEPNFVRNCPVNTNKMLLTPINTRATPTSSVDDLRIKVSTQRKERTREDNTENIPINGAPSRPPKAMYGQPSKICDINLSPSKARGGRGKILREMNEGRLLIHHAPRIQDESSEQSIHISKPAAKTNCVGRSNSTVASRKPWK